jgi:NADH:ubiquinone oxidoreductase subunit K
MMWVAGLMGGTGLACMIFRRSILGLLIGVQILVMGSTLMLVSAGVLSGQPHQGHIFGVFIILGGVTQVVAGYVLAIRLFYLKRNISMDEVRTLKQ